MLFDLLKSQLSGGTIGQMGQILGRDEKSTQSAVTAALPVLLAAMAGNSSSPGGASSLLNALDKDHDGGILDDISGFLGQASSGPGEGILKHVLGSRRPAVERAVSEQSGLDMGSASQLLAMLAPIVMGGLGKVKRQQGLSAPDLAAFLKGEQKSAAREAPDLLTSLLDQDGDGSVVDDLLGMAGRFFKR